MAPGAKNSSNATAGDITLEALPLCLLLSSALDPSGRSTSPKRLIDRECGGVDVMLYTQAVTDMYFKVR